MLFLVGRSTTFASEYNDHKNMRHTQPNVKFIRNVQELWKSNFQSLGRYKRTRRAFCCIHGEHLKNRASHKVIIYTKDNFISL